MNFTVNMLARTEREYTADRFKAIPSKIRFSPSDNSIDKVNIEGLSAAKRLDSSSDEHNINFVFKDCSVIETHIDIDSLTSIYFCFQFSCLREEFPTYYSNCMTIISSLIPDMISVRDDASIMLFDRNFIDHMRPVGRLPTTKMFGIIRTQYDSCFTLKTCGLTRFGIADVILFLPFKLRNQDTSKFEMILNRVVVEAFYDKDFLEGGITLAGIDSRSNFKIPVALAPAAVSPCYDAVDSYARSAARDCLTIMVYKTRNNYAAKKGEDLYLYLDTIVNSHFSLCNSSYQVRDWKRITQKNLHYAAKLVSEGNEVIAFVSKDIDSESILVSSSMDSVVITSYNKRTGTFWGHKSNGGNNEDIIIPSDDIYWWQSRVKTENVTNLITPDVPMRYSVKMR
jgi:hypothetical protein